MTDAEPTEDGAAGRGGPWLRSAFSSLSVRNFRLFFIGQGCSLVGTWMRRTALGWLVYDLTESSKALGVVAALTLLPMLVLSPIAGVVADRVDKRRLIQRTQYVSCAVSAIMGLLILFDVVRVWHAMVLATVGGIAFAFEVPARQSFVFEMVGRKHLHNAIGLNSALVNAGRIAGPALAGFLMWRVGMWLCFMLDAATYLVAIWAMFAIRMPKVDRPPPNEGSALAHLAEGFREILRNRIVSTALALLFLMGVLGWNFQTLLPAVARGDLRIGELQYGILMSVFGAGAIFAALFVAARREQSGRGILMFAGSWIMGAALVLMSLRTDYAWVVATLLAAGFGGVMFLSAANTTIQLSVPDGVRGRVMGVWALGFGGSLPLGSWLSGIVAERIGPMPTIGAGGGILLIASVAAWVVLSRTEAPA